MSWRREDGLFGWLEKKAAQQSLKNIRINSETLIRVANEADKKIEETGSSNERQTKRIASHQKSLLTDIQLALGNKASMEEVLAAVEGAKSKVTVSTGAEMAIKHVLSYVEN